MAYTGKTALFAIPLIKDGEILDETSELQAGQIIENQLRAGILGAGAVRLFEEGDFIVTVEGSDIVSVEVTGSPAIRGIARQGFVEVFGSFEWINLLPGNFYFLYAQADEGTYLNPGDVDPVATLTEETTNDFLFMATLDNTVAGAPVLDTSPAGKPTGANLFDQLNDPIDPHGNSLTQRNVTVTMALVVELTSSGTLSVEQTSASSTTSPLTIVNAGSGAEITSTGELRLKDSNMAAGGEPLADATFFALPSGASSILEALNRFSSPAIRRIGTATDLSSSVEGIIGVTDTSIPRIITILSVDIAQEGRIFIVKDESGGAGTNGITIDTEGAETIDGAATLTISTNFGVARLYSDGTDLFTF